MIIKTAFLASVTALALTAGTASAQEAAPAASATAPAAAVTVGEMVYGPDGSEVGKIDTVAGDNAVVDTGTNKVTLPKASFAKGEKGQMISATKVQLDQLADAAKAEALSQVKLGAGVIDTAGGAVGTITEVAPDYVEVETAAKNKVRLPLESFAKGTTGPVVGATAAQLDEAASKAQAAAEQAAAGGN